LSSNIRVAVLGAAGFIGRNTVRQLARLGVSEILAAARSIPIGEPLPGVSWHSVDFLDDQAVAAFFATTKPTHVVNCVAHGTTPSFKEFDLAFRTNVTAALFAYRLANTNGALRYLHLGTCEEYGRHDKAVGEDEPLSPEGIYALSKAAGTYLLLEEARNAGTELIVLRPFGTWGFGEATHRLVPSIIAGACENRTIPMSDGEQLRDFALVTEVARVVAELTVLAAPSKYRVVNIGSGIAVSVREFALRVADVLGCRELLAFGAMARRPHEANLMIPDVTRLRDLVGRLPTSFDSDVVIAMRDAYERRNRH
jgi:nucleoside-diphosphate-sugar epimerase